ncbi:hypothetical protein [Bradyrhizobium erythrophlei]|jgi:hypothetical protein|uniref:Uncharacterized protein n=1 Tax=Bradyrhizobium erythrophlei TaxID=1437360 RepID=A0A1M5JSI4_9BRAD|nr:hypothetical protein [Bradyrhizobium erythrophlei]SHG43506.1 hypothetical protein SAMN05444169_2457 [Bradyrhizobium erythrophlei]
MGVRLWESGFRSYSAAQLAGKRALEDLLNGLSMDAASRVTALIAGLERNLCAARAWHKQGIAVTFIVEASRGEETTTTVRLSVVVAIAKGRALAEEGWQEFITAPDGIRYRPSEFDRLLSIVRRFGRDNLSHPSHG